MKVLGTLSRLSHEQFRRAKSHLGAAGISHVKDFRSLSDDTCLGVARAPNEQKKSSQSRVTRRRPECVADKAVGQVCKWYKAATVRALETTCRVRFFFFWEGGWSASERLVNIWQGTDPVVSSGLGFPRCVFSVNVEQTVLSLRWLFNTALQPP